MPANSDPAPEHRDTTSFDASSILTWIISNADFARNNFLQLDRELMQLRLLAVSTGGLVASLIFSLFFIQNRNNPETINFYNVFAEHDLIVGAMSLLLSLFYALLGLLYVNLSGQRANTARYLEHEVRCQMQSWQPFYLSEAKNHLSFSTDTLSSRAETLLRHLSMVFWLSQSLFLFIIPAIGLLAVWPLLKGRPISSILCGSVLWQLPELPFSSIYLSAVIVVFVLLFAIGIQWCGFHPKLRKHWWCWAIAYMIVVGFWVAIGWYFSDSDAGAKTSFPIDFVYGYS